MTRIKQVLFPFIKGMAMGGADVVPGVSGGTIAFITGIYQRLLNAIGAFDGRALKMLFTGNWISLWKKLDGAFLLPLLLGIATSILSLAKLIQHLLATYPIPVWAFFFGLILASALIIARSIHRWKAKDFLMLVLGGFIAFGITTLSPATTPEALWFVFITGFVAISAMILPGISGSFILVIMGKYSFILQALSDLNIPVIGVFILGCFFGILSISKGISWLLSRFYNATLALLAGFMVGSLNKVWPWKEVLDYMLDRHGEMKPILEQNVAPNNYLLITGQEPMIIEALIFSVLGFGLVIAIERIAAKVR
jgi:putative membrane protein